MKIDLSIAYLEKSFKINMVDHIYILSKKGTKLKCFTLLCSLGNKEMKINVSKKEGEKLLNFINTNFKLKLL